jgi:hypothetical protein
MASKKKLKKKISELEAEVYMARQMRDSWHRAAESNKQEMQEWRKKYELSQLTQEVKADTEAAFKRGGAFVKQQMMTGLRSMVEALEINPPTGQSR